ncbi:MAG TPA: substrate-binding domain-containing protein [Candidatus Limnocylindria bacterium]|nr:substrate-binding domain-containing protein [Candidatus Limnocylindria bacterium]
MNVYRKWQTRVLPLAMIGTLVLAGCVTTGGSSDGADPGGEGQTVLVSGSSTVEPITSLVAEDFAAQSDGFDYEVDGPGTGDGFALFCDGETDISDASRPISEEEVALCEESGIPWVELKVAVDGISVLTSTANDAVSCLSFGDLYALLGPESQGFDNWSAADDLAAELDGEFGTSSAPFPDAPLEVTAPGEESGTYDSFLEIVFGDIAEAREQDEAARADYTASADDNVIIEGIAGADSSLGWVGFAFYEENADTVKALEVDGGDGCVAPTAESIASNEYPISRDLFIYVNSDRADANPAVAEFVDYYLSDAGIAAVAEAGYVDLTPEALEETRAAWEGR